jgi:hypothetical protein
MKSHCFALAALAAIGFSGLAFAEDGTWTTTTGPAAMSDAEMDGVTAAAGPPGQIGRGLITARTVTDPNVPNDGTENALENGGLGFKGHIPGEQLGHGVCTAGVGANC